MSGKQNPTRIPVTELLIPYITTTSLDIDGQETISQCDFAQTREVFNGSEDGESSGGVDERKEEHEGNEKDEGDKNGDIKEEEKGNREKVVEESEGEFELSSSKGTSTHAPASEKSLPASITSPNPLIASNPVPTIAFPTRLYHSSPPPVFSLPHRPTRPPARPATRPATPTTDELIQYARDIGLFAVPPTSYPSPLTSPSPKAFPNTTTNNPSQEADDLARLREVISEVRGDEEIARARARNQTMKQARGGIAVSKSTSTDIQAEDFAYRRPQPNAIVANTPLAHLGVRVENLPEWVISPSVPQVRFERLLHPHESVTVSSPQDQDEINTNRPAILNPTVPPHIHILAPLAGLGIRVEDLPECAISSSPVKHPDGFPTHEHPSVSPRDRDGGTGLTNLTPGLNNSRPNSPHSSNGLFFNDAMGIFEIEDPQDNEVLTLIPPNAPHPSNLSTPQFPSDEVIDKPDAKFHPFPINPHATSPQQPQHQLQIETKPQVLKVGSVSSSSSTCSLIPVFATPPMAHLGLFDGDSSLQSSPLLGINPRAESSPRYANNSSNIHPAPNSEIWKQLAKTFGFPIFPSHPLTRYNLYVYRLENPISMPMPNTSHEEGTAYDLILTWLHTTSLSYSIVGNPEIHPNITPLSSVWGSSSDLQHSQNRNECSVEIFWRNHLERFTLTLDWVRDVDLEGSIGDAGSLPDEAYDFSFDEEEIIHRSISQPSSISGRVEAKYDGGDENEHTPDDVKSNSDPDPRYRMVDFFRQRYLRKFGGNQANRSHNHSPFGGGNDNFEGGPVQHARTKAVTLAGKLVAAGTVSGRPGEGRNLNSELSSGLLNQDISINDTFKNLGGPLILDDTLDDRHPGGDTELARVVKSVKAKDHNLELPERSLNAKLTSKVPNGDLSLEDSVKTLNDPLTVGQFVEYRKARVKVQAKQLGLWDGSSDDVGDDSLVDEATPNDAELPKSLSETKEPSSSIDVDTPSGPDDIDAPLISNNPDASVVKPQDTVQPPQPHSPATKTDFCDILV